MGKSIAAQSLTASDVSADEKCALDLAYDRLCAAKTLAEVADVVLSFPSVALRRGACVWLPDTHGTSSRYMRHQGSTVLVGTLDECELPEDPCSGLYVRHSGNKWVHISEASDAERALMIIAASAVPLVEQKLAAADALIEESRLRDRLQVLRANIDTSQQITGTATFRWNYATGKDEWSPNLFRIMGYDVSVDEPEYDKFLNGINHEDRDRWLRIAEYSVGNAEPFRWEGRYTRPDGGVRHFLIQGRPDVDTWFHGTVFDTTTMRDTETRLQAAQAEITRAATLTTMGDLAASIAHEINQPLTSIAANVSAASRWLMRDVPELAKVRASLCAVKREAAQAGGVIQGLRSAGTSRSATLTMLRPNQIIQKVANIMGESGPAHNVLIRTDLNAETCIVCADQVQITQVLHNLLQNAIEATSQGANPGDIISVRARCIEGTVVVEVEDRGEGISSEHVDRIFEPFYTTKQTGMGMGLAICRSIIEAHGGTLTAHNTAKGALMRLELDCKEHSGCESMA